MIAGIVRKIVHTHTHTHVHVGCGRGVSLWMTGDDSSKLIGFDGQPLLLFWPSTISNTHCLNKHERPLHSEVTSKTQVQMTSFRK